MVALYLDSAVLSPATTAYTATGETYGTNYVAGGRESNVTLTLSRGECEAVFADVTWTSSIITARGALIYNASQANRAIAVLNFGLDRSSDQSSFIVDFPAVGSDFPVLKIA
jgi:hypothetical protein